MPLTTVVHVLAGGLALVAGYVALFARKGATTHRRSGRVFVYATVVMALTGAAMAALHSVRHVTELGQRRKPETGCRRPGTRIRR